MSASELEFQARIAGLTLDELTRYVYHNDTRGPVEKVCIFCGGFASGSLDALAKHHESHPESYVALLKQAVSGPLMMEEPTVIQGLRAGKMALNETTKKLRVLKPALFHNTKT